MRYQHKFPRVIPHQREDTHMLLTRLPLSIGTSFDLHVLGVPPAYVLSHDQTLKFNNGAHQLHINKKNYLYFVEVCTTNFGNLTVHTSLLNFYNLKELKTLHDKTTPIGLVINILINNSTNQLIKLSFLGVGPSLIS